MMNLKNVVLFLGFAFIFVGCKKEKEVKPDEPKKSQIDTQKLTNLVNAKRSQGCKCGAVQMPATTAVVWSDALEKVAEIHSQDMFTNEFLNETGSDGSSPTDRLASIGYQATHVGASIAWGYPDEEAVIQGWIDKPSACKSIMNPDFSEMGIARAGDYWTIVLSKPNE